MERITLPTSPRLARFAQSNAPNEPIVIPKLVRGFTDHAFPILQGEPTLTHEDREDLWDIFHGSSTPSELADKLRGRNLPPDFVAKFVRAKTTPAVESSNFDLAVQAIHRVSALDPKARAIAEAHPNMLKLLAAHTK